MFLVKDPFVIPSMVSLTPHYTWMSELSLLTLVSLFCNSHVHSGSSLALLDPHQDKTHEESDTVPLTRLCLPHSACYGAKKSISMPLICGAFYHAGFFIKCKSVKHEIKKIEMFQMQLKAWECHVLPPWRHLKKHFLPMLPTKWCWGST